MKEYKLHLKQRENCKFLMPNAKQVVRFQWVSIDQSGWYLNVIGFNIFRFEFFNHTLFVALL
jgi:hypothetical protein